MYVYCVYRYYIICKRLLFNNLHSVLELQQSWIGVTITKEISSEYTNRQTSFCTV